MEVSAQLDSRPRSPQDPLRRPTPRLTHKPSRPGPTHSSSDTLTWAREGRIGFSVGYDITEPVRAAILALSVESWRPALDQQGSERDNGQVAEITRLLELCGWPERSRVIVRRERPHPGAQLSFQDHDGHRFQAILTDQPDTDISLIERRHRARARIEAHVRNDQHTVLANLPFGAATSTPSGSSWS